MNVLWSEQALRALRDRFGDEPVGLKLVYDTEGCGCAVNGVPALWAVDGPEPDDKRAEGNFVPLWHEKRHEIFFEERMRITYDENSRSFSLQSDSQIYTNRLALLDKRNAAASV
ncbi:iron-sulfur cluster biosynthesis family protein [Cohnella thermotolerans]|uniref:iron-sulfur cluster biosynthesis family protein n=1 Tax=Cohnella thermotolerans TaxID=329858 RepID=UPI00042221A5|nr:iron-sulfur cluster biosynthesis family protein [Cohnella thermotolerans]